MRGEILCLTTEYFSRFPLFKSDLLDVKMTTSTLQKNCQLWLGPTISMLLQLLSPYCVCFLKESKQIKLVWIQPSSNLVGEREEGYVFSTREKKHSVLGKVNIKCLKISIDGGEDPRRQSPKALSIDVKGMRL